MFPEAVHRFRLLGLRVSSGTRALLPGRHLADSAARSGAQAPRRRGPARVKMEIPGLEPITYAERMHYVPGLARPLFPPWERGWRDPGHYRSPRPPAQHGSPPAPACYIWHQRTNALEGVRQALWLTKTQLTNGLPTRVTSLGGDPANHLAEQDGRVQDAIRHARFWDTTQPRPPRGSFCLALVRNLLHLCGGLQTSLPGLGGRMLAENPRLSATWSRGEDLFQVRGQSGLLLTSRTGVPGVCGRGEVQATEEHTLDTFYPVSPTIDLARTHLYTPETHTGFREGYLYPHAHTLFLLEEDGHAPKLLPDQLRAKMIMFSFANALARAHTLHGPSPQVLPQPVVVHAVGTNGRVFQYLVFQLNTSDLRADQGVKNQAWMDHDCLLYDHAMVRDIVKKRTVQVPAGLSGYNPETFQKFLGLYLHGAT